MLHQPSPLSVHLSWLQLSLTNLNFCVFYILSLFYLLSMPYCLLNTPPLCRGMGYVSLQAGISLSLSLVITPFLAPHNPYRVAKTTIPIPNITAPNINQFFCFLEVTKSPSHLSINTFFSTVIIPLSISHWLLLPFKLSMHEVY